MHSCGKKLLKRTGLSYKNGRLAVMPTGRISTFRETGKKNFAVSSLHHLLDDQVSPDFPVIPLCLNDIDSLCESIQINFHDPGSNRSTEDCPARKISNSNRFEFG